MAQRRDRPPEQARAGGVRVRLGDGRMISVPVQSVRRPADGDACCFCGEAVGQADAERALLTVAWNDGGEERRQQWGAHRACLKTRLHQSVQGQGPSAGD